MSAASVLRMPSTVIGPEKFLNKTWNVIANCPADQPDPHECKVEIHQVGEGYNLMWWVEAIREWRLLQAGLLYNGDSDSLENEVGATPQRSIRYWVRPNDLWASIFALRIGPNPAGSPAELPWFELDPNGSWGAEEG